MSMLVVGNLFATNAMSTHYLPDDEFYSIYGRVPRLAVDVLMMTEQGVLLTQRSIEPYKGCWHLPGGTVYMGETIESAAIRIAKKETGLDVEADVSIGHMEFLDEVRNSVDMHTVSIVVPARVVGGVLQRDRDSSELRWFTIVPTNTIKQHAQFLRERCDMTQE